MLLYISGLRHNRATAAFFRPMDHRVLASSLVAQPGSGIVPPRLIPVPNHEPPPLTEPRHVSNPAAVNPGANAVGTFVIDWLAGVD
jgi:hypothetical protein